MDSIHFKQDDVSVTLTRTDGSDQRFSQATIFLGSAEGSDFIWVGADGVQARIDQMELGLVVTDLQSKTGTFLNGKRITRARLQNGDRLHLTPPPEPVPFRKDPVLEMNQFFGAISGSSDRGSRFLDKLVEVFFAHRGILLLDHEWVAGIGVAKETFQSDEFGYYREWIQKTLLTGESALMNNAADPRLYDGHDPLRAINLITIYSIAIVPVGRSGAVYLDRRVNKGPFGEVDLQRLATIAKLLILKSCQ